MKDRQEMLPHREANLALLLAPPVGFSIILINENM